MFEEIKAYTSQYKKIICETPNNLVFLKCLSAIVIILFHGDTWKKEQKKNIFNNFLKIINLCSSNFMPLSHYLIALN